MHSECTHLSQGSKIQNFLKEFLPQKDMKMAQNTVPGWSKRQAILLQAQISLSFQQSQVSQRGHMRYWSPCWQVSTAIIIGGKWPPNYPPGPCGSKKISRGCYNLVMFNPSYLTQEVSQNHQFWPNRCINPFVAALCTVSAHF